MNVVVNLYSLNNGDIETFLKKFYGNNIKLENPLKWEKKYDNPVEITEIMGTLIDNNEKYKINIWISLDEGLFINVTENNIDDLIKYIFERYPY